MGFLWGFIMYFISHTFVNSFANNLYCYWLENKAEDANRYAIKQYLTNAIISIVVYITVFIVALTVDIFSEHTSAILIGSGIGFITAFIHFIIIADDNYAKQKQKNDARSLSYMSFEEKMKAIEEQQNVDAKETYSRTSTNQTKKSLHHIYDDDYIETFGKNKSYCEIITEYFENEKNLKTNIEVAPNGDEIITVNYQINYLWTLCIEIDENKEIITIYTPFFNVAPSKRNDIYEILNEWNRKFFFIKFFFEDTAMGPFVIAANDVPLTAKSSIGKFVFDIGDEFIRTIDDQYGKIPEDIKGL